MIVVALEYFLINIYASSSLLFLSPLTNTEKSGSTTVFLVIVINGVGGGGGGWGVVQSLQTAIIPGCGVSVSI